LWFLVWKAPSYFFLFSWMQCGVHLCWNSWCSERPPFPLFLQTLNIFCTGVLPRPSLFRTMLVLTSMLRDPIPLSLFTAPFELLASIAMPLSLSTALLLSSYLGVLIAASQGPSPFPLSVFSTEFSLLVPTLVFLPFHPALAVEPRA